MPFNDRRMTSDGGLQVAMQRQNDIPGPMGTRAGADDLNTWDARVPQM